MVVRYCVVLIIFAFLPCIQAKSKCSFQNAFVRIDTTGRFVVYKTSVEIQLPDSLNFASDEKTVVCIQVDKIRNRKIAKWSIFLFRIYKEDSVVFSFSEGQGQDIPLYIRKYVPLIEKYVETVRIKQLPLRYGGEGRLVLVVRFRNSK